MNSIVDRLYPLPHLHRTPLSTVLWWERRRLFYNRAIGTAGLVTLAGLFAVSPHPSLFLDPAVLAVVVLYGVTANVFYTFGWLAELLARAVWGNQAPRMGPLLFREGLIFSVGLTLFPLGLWIVLMIVGAVSDLGWF